MDPGTPQDPGNQDAGQPTDPTEKFPGGRPRPAAAEESTLWEGGYSAKDMLGSFFLVVIISVGAIVAAIFLPFLWVVTIAAIAIIWVIQLVRVAWAKMSVGYELTSRRFMHEHGVLSRSTDRIEVIDIDDVTVIQSIFDRMLNVGTIRITSSDRTHPEIDLHGIDDVKVVAKMMDDARQVERDRRGVYIESV